MKKQLLDPLGTLCKLVGLNFTKIKTKISIHSHILKLDEPDQLQFFMRWYNGDDRENVSELYYVIIRIIKWYLVPKNNDTGYMNKEIKYIENSDQNNFSNNSPDDRLVNIKGIEIEELDKSGSSIGINAEEIAKSEELRKMVKYLCEALRKLQETYKFGNVVLAIQYFINILESALEGRFDESMLPNYIYTNDKEYENLLDYNKIRNFWDVRTLKTICDLYDNCFNILNNSEIPDNTKRALIEGYLKSIRATLDITDKDFQTLITNSRKG